MTRDRLARLRGYWLLAGVWVPIVAVGADPAAAIAALGLGPLLAGLGVVLAVELLAIRASLRRDPDYRQLTRAVALLGAVGPEVTPA